MLVLTRSSGRPSKRRPMSSRVEIATPTRPTSPRASGASLSYPICVGRSNATLSPSLPCARRYWNRRFVSFAVPKPAYCRIVQRRPRYIVARMPRVNDASHDPSLHIGTEGADHVLRILRRRDEGEAHSHVEGLVHLAALDPAELGEGAEDRGRLERIGDSELHVGLEPDEVPHAPSRDV